MLRINRSYPKISGTYNAKLEVQLPGRSGNTVLFTNLLLLVVLEMLESPSS